MKTCSTCYELKTYNEYGRNRSHPDGYRSECNKCRRLAWKQFYKNNKEKESLRKKQQYIKYRKEIIKKTSAYNINRRKIDPIFRLKNNLRKRIRNVLLSKRLNKSNTFQQYIGCTLSELKNHIEKQFKSGMTWNNYGKWEIDHILPFAQHTDINILYARCHYTNLQPMWMSENRSKCDNE